LKEDGLQPNRTEQAYTILRARIMDGTYGPGHRLVIDQLRRDSDISTIPWRESLRRLEAEGWVEIIPNTGARVRTFDTDAWEKTIRLLARLEGLATSLAVGRISAADIADARQVNADMAEALRSFDPHRFGQLNQRFHLAVCSHCDDPRLTELLQTEWARLELVRRSAFYYAPGRAMKAVSEHDMILDLLEGGADPDLVESAAKQHKLNTLHAVREHEESIAADGG
jgi:DNA-binding GntR family transcriptional regulator